MAVSRATSAEEARMVSTLGTVAQDSREAGLQAPTLFIIGKVVSLYAGKPQDLAVEAVSANG